MSKQKPKTEAALIPETRGPVVTMNQWFADPALRKQWAETWELPHMKAGLQAMISLNLPRALESVQPGLSVIEMQALRQCRAEGFYSAIALIEQLKKEPGQIANKVTSGWGVASLDNPPKQ